MNKEDLMVLKKIYLLYGYEEFTNDNDFDLHDLVLNRLMEVHLTTDHYPYFTYKISFDGKMALKYMEEHNVQFTK